MAQGRINSRFRDVKGTRNVDGCAVLSGAAAPFGSDTPAPAGVRL